MRALRTSERLGNLVHLLAATAVVLAACSDAGDDAIDSRPDEPGSTTVSTGQTPVLDDCRPLARGSDPVTLTFWHAEEGHRAQVLTSFVQAFEDFNPGIRVQLEAVDGGPGELMARWREATPEERPSVTLLPHGYTGRLVDSGQTVAPAHCVDEGMPDMLPAIRAAWTTGGVMRALPFAVSTPVLVIDNAAFRAAGLDPGQPPRTPEDLRAAAQRVVDSGAATYGLAVDTNPEGTVSWLVDQWMAQAGQYSLMPDNGRGQTATGVAWRTGTAVDSLDWLRGMVDDGLAVSVGPNDEDGLDDLRRLRDAQAPAAMAIHSSGALREFNDQLPVGERNSPDVTVAPLPGPGPGPGSAATGSALWMAAGKPADEQRAAWMLMTFMALQNRQTTWVRQIGDVPIRTTAARTPGTLGIWSRYPQLQVAYDVLATQPVDAPRLAPVAGPLPEIHAALARAVRAVVDEGEEPATALDEAAAEADRLLTAYATGTRGGASGAG